MLFIMGLKYYLDHLLLFSSSSFSGKTLFLKIKTKKTFIDKLLTETSSSYRANFSIKSTAIVSISSNCCDKSR